MPMTLIERIGAHHEDLVAALEQLEVLARSSTPDVVLPAKLDALRHRLLAHELTTDRLVVGPLCRLRLLDAGEFDRLGDELTRLAERADGLSRSQPDAEAVRALVEAIRHHLERRARALDPAARSALAEGRLSRVPGWYVEDVYELHGGPVAHTPEEWLG